MTKDLVLLKKYYGEAFSHFCRDLFPSILEEEGKLFSIIDSHFAHNHYLFEDIMADNLVDDFKSYIYGFMSRLERCVQTDLTPFELMDEAGYDLYECNSEEDIQSFKKYYRIDEEICTFRGNRLESCYVFFAVKKDVNKIKRENFSKPERQDLYGTSVISIQFSKSDNNYLSIKNRYNHTVVNPDATFGNNLDNIIPGLTYSFENTYGYNICNKEDELYLPNYVMASDGKLYKYNYEIFNIHYCPDNIIIDNGKIIRDYQDKSKYIFLDYFIIDMKEKTIFCYDNTIDDSFQEQYKNFEKIRVSKKDKYHIIKLFYADNEVELKIDDLGKIISFRDDNLLEVDDNFLHKCTYIEEVICTKLFKIHDNFLADAIRLRKLFLQEVSFIGNNFLYNNLSLTRLNLPNVFKIGDGFLYSNSVLRSIKLPKVINIDNDFLVHSMCLENLSCPNLEIVGDNFLVRTGFIWNFNLESLKIIGHNFLCSFNYLKNGSTLDQLTLNNVVQVGCNFMANNTSLLKLDLPNVVLIDDNFLCSNTMLQKINIPKVEEIGNAFLENNTCLTKLILPNVKIIGNDFLTWNGTLEVFEAPTLIQVGKYCLHSNQNLRKLEFPNLEKMDSYFLIANKELKSFIAPKLNCVSHNSFYANTGLEYLEIRPDCFMYRDSFFAHPDQNKIIKSVKKDAVWKKKQRVMKKLWKR